MTEREFEILTRYTLMAHPYPAHLPAPSAETLRKHYLRDVGYLLDALEQCRTTLRGAPTQPPRL